MNKQRVLWVDIAKAIAIVAVVLGHAATRHGTIFHFIYWWHMPLFFIAGGFFLKPVINNDWGGFYTKKIRPLLIAYFAAGSFLIILSHFIRKETWSYTAFYFVRLLYGGRTLNHYLSVFWFINVYILTLIFVTLVITYVKSREMQLIIAFISLVISNSYKSLHFLRFQYLPWDFDVAFIAAFFMLVGYLYFDKFKQLVTNVWVTLTCALVTMWLVWMQHIDQLNFGFFMKSRQIHASLYHVAISRVSYIMIIPIMVCTVIFAVSYYISKTHPIIYQPFIFLGKQTMGIMFLHKAVIDIVNEFGYDSALVESALAIVISLVLTLIYNYFKQLYTNKIKVGI